MKELLVSNWFTGPKFLWDKEMSVSKEHVPELLFGDPEVKTFCTLNTECTKNLSLIDGISKFSSWSKAIRAVAPLLRRANKVKSNHLSTVSERQKAELHIIKCFQDSSYKDELREIKSGRSVLSRSTLYSLDPFMDKDGVLRVGGRLCRSTFPDSVKHPIIIPNCTFS